MTGFLVILFRFLLVYFIVKLVWQAFAGKNNSIAQDKKKEHPQSHRFDTRDENVADADYEEMK